jgi:hypothetical protein
MSGERGDVKNETMEEWLDKLPAVCSGYSPENIFNMDETGLFYRATTKNTYHIKGDDCASGKMSKDRVTVALCASMTGEKLKPLLIGKSENPRCVSKIKTDSLPVDYKFNNKSWMNSKLFESWISKVNKIMRRQKRQIVLFNDIAPSHPNLTYSNVTLKFFPANTTSKSQPMDQGIIQTTKLKFRKKQLLYMIREMEKKPKNFVGLTF